MATTGDRPIKRPDPTWAELVARLREEWRAEGERRQEAVERAQAERADRLEREHAAEESRRRHEEERRRIEAAAARAATEAAAAAAQARHQLWLATLCKHGCRSGECSWSLCRHGTPVPPGSAPGPEGI